MNIEVLWDGTYGLSSLSEKTRKSNRLQMSFHFLLSYLKTLSVGPARVRTHDLPHGSPVLNQLSQPVGGHLKAFFHTPVQILNLTATQYQNQNRSKPLFW